MNYTKGEWKAIKVKDMGGNPVFGIFVNPDNRIQRLADVWIEANANLIAASPQMYKSLHGALWLLKGGRVTSETGKDLATPKVIGEIEQAIAKAEGKDSDAIKS